MRVALISDTAFVLIIPYIGLIFITIVNHQHFVIKTLLIGGLNPIIITVD